MPSKLAPAFGRLPTHLDLPDTDGEPVENDYQKHQTTLLDDSIRAHLNLLHPDGNFLIAANMGIYYQITDPPLRGCKAPDWFYVPNVAPVLPDLGYRRSFVMWQELVRPAVAIEYVSDITKGEEHDRTPETGKFWVYERAIAIPYYIIYEPREVKLEVYRMDGIEYRVMAPDDRGFYYIQPLRLNLGLHYDTYSAQTFNWLRWFDRDGNLLETHEEQLAEEKVRTSEERERADLEKQRAEQAMRRAYEETRRADEERRRADEEQRIAQDAKRQAVEETRRAEKLAAKLRKMGIDPDTP